MEDQKKYNKLESKRVLILGGTSGLGYATAEACLEAGAIVVVSSSNQLRVESSVSRLQSSYPSRKAHVSGFQCDLGHDSTLEQNLVELLKQSTDDGAKKFDHVVFSAADPLASKSLQEFDLKAMHDAGRIRFFAPMLLAKHAKEYVTPGRQSSFTITTGGVAERPIPNWSVIGAYAAGHGGMVRGLAIDLAPLRFNAVSPGLVDTELWKDVAPDAKAQMYKNTAAHVPTGVVAKPEDVAESFVYLMRDFNVTGSIIHSDSGYLLK